MCKSASANLTRDFIKTRLHHGYIIAEYFDFFFGKAFSKNSTEYQ